MFQRFRIEKNCTSVYIRRALGVLHNTLGRLPAVVIRFETHHCHV